MTPQGQFRLAYRPALDGLRGVAILLVLLYHAGFPVARGGFLGVDVFFVLSGFLITALLMQERDRTGSMNLQNFYARRALRLLPALIVLLAFFLLLPWLFGVGFARWKLALVVLFYCSNWVSAFMIVNPGILVHTWSLAIEEQFYIVWPPLLKLLLSLKAGRLGILGLILSGIVSVSVLRVELWQSFGDARWPRLYYGLDTRMDSLLTGCLIGLLAAWNLLPRQGRWLTATRYAAALSAAITLALAHGAPERDSSLLYHGLEQLLCLAVGILIIGLMTSPPKFVSSVLEQPALVWVGRVSYGLYLWHIPVFYGVLNDERMTRLEITGSALTLLRFAAAFATAAVSFYLVEQPMLRLKGRFREGPPARKEKSATRTSAREDVRTRGTVAGRTF